MRIEASPNRICNILQSQYSEEQQVPTSVAVTARIRPAGFSKESTAVLSRLKRLRGAVSAELGGYIETGASSSDLHYSERSG